MRHQIVDGCGRRVEDRGRIETENDGQHDQRVEHDLFTQIQIENALEALFGQRAENHPAIEPEGVAGRKDHAKGGTERHPGIDLEHAHHGEELADETGRARQAHIGHGEDHEGKGIARHALDQMTPTQRKSAPETMPCEIIWNMAP